METIRQIIEYTSEDEWHALRAADLTSTDIAALLGISPYLTKYELWHRKRDGLHVASEPTERMRWGNRLESAIAQGIADDNDWLVRARKTYTRLPGLRIGASFDFEITRIADVAGVQEAQCRAHIVHHSADERVDPGGCLVRLELM